MKPFMDDNFLLQGEIAQKLYEEHAAHLPIIDYHCHLNPRLIAENYRFRSITELWLGGDHYKWRAMRANGVDEKLITGKRASDWERFSAWAETVPYTMRNPLYHWTHLELKTAFGIERLLGPDTAREIYEECNARLTEPEYTARGLLKHYNVEVVCTTDDPIDDLRWHKQLAKEGFEVRVLPAWRPDKLLRTDHPNELHNYILQLGEAAGIVIRSYEDFVEALRRRHQYFHEAGCRLSDHGLEEFYDEGFMPTDLRNLVKKVIAGIPLGGIQARVYKSGLLTLLAEMDWESGWVQQYHYGAQRDNRSVLYHSYGPDAGADSIGEWACARSMARFFDRLDKRGHLAKTIIYNLNPAANAVVATMIGNFQDGSTPGKMQMGSGWWFMDQKSGIEAQLDALSTQGLLSRFVGMLTDSRSFLSFPRHEYFRRVLCNLIGQDVERGELPAQAMERIGSMVEDICYYNAKSYFNF